MSEQFHETIFSFKNKCENIRYFSTNVLKYRTYRNLLFTVQHRLTGVHGGWIV